jgi:hypothetical protein
MLGNKLQILAWPFRCAGGSNRTLGTPPRSESTAKFRFFFAAPCIVYFFSRGCCSSNALQIATAEVMSHRIASHFPASLKFRGNIQTVGMFLKRLWIFFASDSLKPVFSRP